MSRTNLEELSLPERIYLSALAEALDGFSDGTCTYRAPRFLAKGGQGMALCVERQGHPAPGLPQVTMAVLKVPWPGGGHDIREECRRRAAIGALPHLGEMPLLLELPLSRLASAAPERPDGDAPQDPAGDTPQDPDGDAPELAGRTLPILVVPLRHDRMALPIPQPLYQVIPPYGPRVLREIENWLNCAQALSDALWILHERGWAHGDLTRANIVVRQRYGWWRDITVVDFGSAGEHCHEPAGHGPCVTPEYVRPERLLAPQRGWIPALEDLYALGVCLVEILLGTAAVEEIGQEAERGPTGPGPAGEDTARLRYARSLRECARLAAQAGGDFRERALYLCVRYLLADPPAGATSIQLLQDFRAEVESLRFSLRRVPRHRTPDLPVRDNLLSWQLIDLCQLLGEADLRPLCQRDVQRPGPDRQAGTFAGCVGLLRDGYCSAAADGLYHLLRRRTLASKPDLLRALRLFAGVLEARQERYERADEVLALYADDQDLEVVRWARVLSAKLAYHRGRREDAGGLGPAPGDHSDRRLRAWELVLSSLHLLHTQRQLGQEEIGEIRRSMQAAVSSHESAFGALVLARAYASDRTVAHWPRVLPLLQMSANFAALRGLPHEYAAALVTAAAIVLGAFQDPVLGPALYRDGADPDECLVGAAECALKAAEIYRGLELHTRSRRALERAAECFLQCGSPDHRAEALRWLSLARNNANLLPGAAVTADESGIERAVARWRSAAGALAADLREADPGSFRAADYYNRYGRAIEVFWQTDGSITAELPASPGSAQEGPGAVLRALLGAAGLLPVPPGCRLLELSCGVGAEALRAAELGFDVLGVDGFQWCIDEARRRCTAALAGRPAVRARLRFERLDLAQVARGRDGAFDVALARESLCHVSQKRLALRTLSRCLLPGGVLLLSDLVQQRPSTVASWRELFETVWFTNLETEEGYRAMLAAVDLELLYLHRAHDELHGFLLRRLQRLRAMERELKLETRHRAQVLLSALARLSDSDGPLGWILLVARKRARSG